MAMRFDLDAMQVELGALDREFQEAERDYGIMLWDLDARRQAIPYDIAEEERNRIVGELFDEELVAIDRLEELQEAREEQHEQRERMWGEIEARINDRGGQDRNRDHIQRLWGAWQLAHEAVEVVQLRAFEEERAPMEELLAEVQARGNNSERWRDITRLRFNMADVTENARGREDEEFERLIRYALTTLDDLEAEARGDQEPPAGPQREVQQRDAELPSPLPLYTPPPQYITPQASPQQANTVLPQNEALQAAEAPISEEEEAIEEADAPPPSPPNVNAAPGGRRPTPPNNPNCEELLAQARASLTRVTAARDQARTQRDNAIARRDLALEAINQQEVLHVGDLRLRDQQHEFGNLIATAVLEQARTERDEARAQRDEAWNRRDEEYNNYAGELADLRRQLEVAESAVAQIVQAENIRFEERMEELEAQIMQDEANRFEERMRAIEGPLLRGSQTTDDGSQTTNHGTETTDEGENPCVDIENQRDAARAMLAEAIRARDQARRFLVTRTTERDAERDEKIKLIRELIDAGKFVIPAYEECVEARDAAHAEIDRLTLENEALVRVSAEAGVEVFEELDTLRQELEDANTQIAGLTALRDLVNNVLNDRAPELDDRVQELQDELDRINQEREDCADELANIRQECEDCEESLEEANRKLKGLKKNAKKDLTKRNGKGSKTTKVVKTKKATTTRVLRATTTRAVKKPLPSPTLTESTITSVESSKTDLDYEPSSASDYQPTGSKKRAAPGSSSKRLSPRKTRRTK